MSSAPASPTQVVVVITAEENIIAVPAKNSVITGETVHRVIATAALNVVGTVTADQSIAAISSIKRIIPGTAIKR